MAEVMTRPDPILSHLSDWTAAKEDQRCLTKLGAEATPRYRRAQDAEGQAVEKISRTVPQTIHGLAATLDFYEAAFAAADVSLPNETGLRVLRQMAKSARQMAGEG